MINNIRYKVIVLLLLFGVNTTIAKSSGADSSFQHDTKDCFTLYFRFDKSVIDSSYMGNVTALQKLDRLLDSSAFADIDSIAITASGSPDGMVEHNALLARRRGKALKRYIIRKYPHADKLNVVLYTVAEDWEGLRTLVANTPDVPYREQILKTLSVPVNPATKKWRLKQIGGGKAWKYIERHFLTRLRAGCVDITFYLKNRVAAEPEVNSDTTQMLFIPDLPALAESITVDATGTVKIFRIPFSIKTQPAQGRPKQKQLIALKTNLLELAAGVVNLGFEWGLSKKLSVDIPVDYSPYTLSQRYRTRVLAARPEMRYWFAGTFHGHFIGIHLAGGIYNLAVDSQTRYQSNRMAWGAGISYGYTLAFSLPWKLEFGIGAGYINTSYDCYYNIPDGRLYGSHTKRYWGLTKASISIVYLLNRRAR